jgi:hypothetical protein
MGSADVKLDDFRAVDLVTAGDEQDTKVSVAPALELSGEIPPKKRKAGRPRKNLPSDAVVTEPPPSEDLLSGIDQ